MKNVARIAYYNFYFDHICRKQVYGGLKIDFLLITLVFYFFLEMIKVECKFFLLKDDMIYIPNESSWVELQLLFRVFGKKIHIRGSNKSIFDFYSSKISYMMSKNEFFNQLFQIIGTDTQRKSCSSWSELSENVFDGVGSWFRHGLLNRTKKVKFSKNMLTSRVYRKLFKFRLGLSTSLT